MSESVEMKIEGNEIVTTITHITEKRQSARTRLTDILYRINKIDNEIILFMKEKNDLKRILFLEKEMLENQGIIPYENGKI